MLKENEQTRTYPLITRLLVTGGAIGPLLFILVFLVEGATRPGYSVWRNQVSQLSLSDQGWMQIANFLMCGLLTLGFAIGLRQVLRSGRGAVWGPILLGVFGVGLIIAGLFATDPSVGYPPGAAVNGLQSFHGALHGIAGGFIVPPSLAAACFVMTRRFAGDPATRGWARYSLASGILFLVFFIGAIVVSSLDANGVFPNAPAGLLQRAGIIIGWGWIALVAIHYLRQMRSSASPARASLEADAEGHTGQAEVE